MEGLPILPMILNLLLPLTGAIWGNLRIKTAWKEIGEGRPDRKTESRMRVFSTCLVTSFFYNLVLDALIVTGTFPLATEATVRLVCQVTGFTGVISALLKGISAAAAIQKAGEDETQFSKGLIKISAGEMIGILGFLFGILKLYQRI